MEIYPKAEKRCKTKLAELHASLATQTYKDHITTKLELYEQNKATTALVIPEARSVFQ
ncbi:coiled-coil protein [Legionella sainthelensi]|nr:coiled-coil protein [Legionella sainthelensi]